MVEQVLTSVSLETVNHEGDKNTWNKLRSSILSARKVKARDTFLELAALEEDQLRDF